MKKAMVALLTTIIGIFGFTVVDKTTDDRLAALENEVSSLSYEVSSLKNRHTTSIITSLVDKSCNIKIALPATDTRQSFEVLVNNESKISKNLIMDGSNYTFTVTGLEANSNVVVYIDGAEYYTCIVDFSNSTPSVSNEKYSNHALENRKAELPDVTGLATESAKAKLKEAGFNNIKVESKILSDPNLLGKVISQSPECTASTDSTIDNIISGNTISTSTEVTIVVGTAEGAEI